MFLIFFLCHKPANLPRDSGALLQLRFTVFFALWFWMGGCWWGEGVAVVVVNVVSHTIVIYFRVNLQRNLKWAVVSRFNSSRKCFNLLHDTSFYTSLPTGKKCYFCFYSHCNFYCVGMCSLHVCTVFPKKENLHHKRTRRCLAGIRRKVQWMRSWYLHMTFNPSSILHLTLFTSGFLFESIV